MEQAQELAQTLRVLNADAAVLRDRIDGVFVASIHDHTLHSFVNSVLACEKDAVGINERSRATYPVVQETVRQCRKLPKVSRGWRNPDGSDGPCAVLLAATAAHELLLIDELAPRVEILRQLPHDTGVGAQWRWWRMQRSDGQVPEGPTDDQST